MELDWKDCGDTQTNGSEHLSAEAPGIGETIYVVYSSRHGHRLEVHAKRLGKHVRILTLGWRSSLESAKLRAAVDFAACRARFGIS